MSAELQPKDRIKRWRSYLVLWGIHRILGLGFAALIILVSVTGSLLVIHHDLEKVVSPSIYTVDEPESGEDEINLNELLMLAQELAPEGYRPLQFQPNEHPRAAHKLVFIGEDPSVPWSVLYDPYGGPICVGRAGVGSCGSS